MAKCVQLRTMGLVLLIVYLSALPSLTSCARDYEFKLGLKRDRHLLNTPSTPACVTQFQTMNYTAVTRVCNSTKPSPNAACCAAFNEFACQYPAEVNNFQTVCPIVFLSYLNLAGNYQDGYFVGQCIDGTKGLCVQ